jgi:hypothetical protein
MDRLLRQALIAKLKGLKTRKVTRFDMPGCGYCTSSTTAEGKLCQTCLDWLARLEATEQAQPTAPLPTFVPTIGVP